MAEDRPTAATSVVALHDRREAVIALLGDSFAHDLLELDELERRLELAQRATSLAELELLVADLSQAVQATATALVPVALESALAAWPERRAVRAILGGFVKRGRWTVARALHVTCFWGGGILDFREATLAPGVTELHITSIMGGCEIIVPPGLPIECDAIAILGGFEHLERGTGGPAPGRALLRITGLALLGGVTIEMRLPGESAQAAKRRRERHRKTLKA